MNLSIERTHLDGLVMFLAVAELRGFRAASRQLGVTPSAVSQAIRNLEERIGSPLFSRTTRSVGLTEAGERLFALARPAVDMLTAGLEAASSLGGQISGRLRINVPRASLPLLVNRLLPGFLDLHPDVQLELVGEDRMIDIVDEGFDAGIRLGHFVEMDMVAVRLTPADLSSSSARRSSSTGMADRVSRATCRISGASCFGSRRGCLIAGNFRSTASASWSASKDL